MIYYLLSKEDYVMSVRYNEDFKKEVVKAYMAGNKSISRLSSTSILPKAQSAVLRQINSLETELGSKLFNRSTRSVSLTPAGISFPDDAKGKVTLILDYNAGFSFTIFCTSSE